MDAVEAAAALIRELNSLWLLTADSSAERAEKLQRRRDLGERLCEALDGYEDIAAATAHDAARVLLGIQTGGTRFVERACALARRSWREGHEGGGPLYARATDLLFNLRGEPQRYGTLVYVRHGEKVLQPVDPMASDEERAQLGLESLAALRQQIAAHNHRLAVDLAATTGLPDGVDVRRVWRDDIPAELLRQRDTGGAPVWRDGEDLVFVWESEAEEVSLTGGLQLPLWRLGTSDVWVLRLRIRELDRAIVSHGFLATTGGQTRYAGGDGCWRGPQAPPAPTTVSRLAGQVIKTERPGPEGIAPRPVWVYRPPNHVAGLEYPVVYLADGRMTPSLAAILEAAILDGRMPPTVVVGVASGRQGGEDIRNDEYIPGRHPARFEAHRAFFVEAVARWAESDHGAAKSRGQRSVFGVSSGATFALTMGLRHPERFGRVIAFSVGVVPVVPHRWSTAPVPTHYLAAGKLEEGFRATTASWAGHVREAGGKCVHVEVVSGHDYRMWEGQSVEAMASPIPDARPS